LFFATAMMRKHLTSIAAGCLACLLIMQGSFRLLSAFSAHAADAECAGLAAEIADAQAGGGSLQNWIDDTLIPKAGQSSSDFYIMALAAQGEGDLSGYADALQPVLAGDTASSASSKERMALALAACSAPPPQICSAILDENAEKLGVMSRVFGLHLINNGVQSDKYTNGMLVSALSALQCSDGGWSLSGGYGDPDVTAMVLQALAPYQSEASVKNAVADGIAFLSAKQLQSGAFQSYGTENAESTAQVWIALSSLGIDALRDSRFLKNGNSLLDGILQFRVGSGAYAHAAGGSVSALATMQVYLALTAAQCSRPLYLFHNADPRLHTAQATGTSQIAGTTAPATGSGSPVQTSQTAQNDGSSTRTQTDAQAGQSQQQTDASAGSESITTVLSGTETVTQILSVTADAAADPETVTTVTTVTTVRTAAVSTELLTTAPPDNAAEQSSKYPYRIPLTAGAAAVFGAVAVFCFIRKKRSVKTYLTIAAGFCAVTAGIWLIRAESPEQYYQTQTRSGGTVTMEIRCDVILGLDGSEYFPADGIIMQKTEFSIDEGENALDLLYDAVKAYQLQVEVDGISGDVVETAYVRGIASLYEFDFGDLSGWTYTVNGVRPPVGCGACTLSDGDEIAWVYTVNL